MVRMLFFLFSIISAFFTFTQISHAIVDSQLTVPTEPRYVADEVIVKYKNGQSPDELKAMLQKKLARKKTIIGFFQVFFENLSAFFRKQETLEEKIKRLEEADKKAGVISKKPVFTSPSPELKNVFLLKLKEKNKVLETIELYKTLSEVEYAEPNHILRIQ